MWALVVEVVEVEVVAVVEVEVVEVEGEARGEVC